MTLSELRKLADAEILTHLRNAGIEVSPSWFREHAARFRSVQQLALWVCANGQVSLRNPPKYLIWGCLCVLWERWIPEITSEEMLDDEMFLDGLSFRLEPGNQRQRCDYWLGFWEKFLAFCDRHQVVQLDDLKELLGRSETFSMLSGYYEIDLWNEGLNHPQYHQYMRQYLEVFLERFPREPLDVRQAFQEQWESVRELMEIRRIGGL